MKPTAAIQVEGVLRKTIGATPNLNGRLVYHCLAAEFNVVLVTSEVRANEHMKTWLAMEGFDKHAHVVHQDVRTWLDIASHLKISLGTNLQLCVQPDPEQARDLIEHGFNCLLWSEAAYMLPEWRPDQNPGIRAWDDLVAEMTEQKLARARDKRMEDDPLR